MTIISFVESGLVYLSKDPSELLVVVQVEQLFPGTALAEGH
jgi:hypothetical protein